MDQSWSRLKDTVDSSILQAISALHFENMTAVQAACIPHFVNNKDVAVEAITGSGKTLAFVVPIMQILCKRETMLKKHEIGAIIMTPTRELAGQISEVVNHFIQFLPQFTSCLLIGGANIQSDIDKFIANGGHIVIATPGRLEDMFQRKVAGFTLAASVKALEMLILDEADRLLDMGFETSINAILSYLPKLRRTGLFSATQTDEVQKLIRAGLRNPLQITVKEKVSKEGYTPRTPSLLKNYYMFLEADEKMSQLVRFLQHHKKEKILLFFSTCACVDYFSLCLQQIIKKVPILSIHSKMKNKRSKIFSTFRDMASGILMCTDVMARGIDIPDIHWVIQYDPPSSASSFVHRCGRTARIGNHGNALVMLLPTEDSYIRFIELNQKVPLTEMSKQPDAADVSTRLQTLAINDRSVYEKGLRAFVSYIQSYAKHECNMILRLKDLDFGRLAQGFGLIHVPKMPELKGKSLSNFQPIEIDLATISYKDKIREKLRQGRMASDEGVKKVKLTRPPRIESWSKHKDKNEKRKIKKQDRMLKGQKRQLEVDDKDEENDDFDEDIRLMKRLKKGKISKEEFDKEFAGELSD